MILLTAFRLGLYCELPAINKKVLTPQETKKPMFFNIGQDHTRYKTKGVPTGPQIPKGNALPQFQIITETLHTNPSAKMFSTTLYLSIVQLTELASIFQTILKFFCDYVKPLILIGYKFHSCIVKVNASGIKRSRLAAVAECKTNS